MDLRLVTISVAVEHRRLSEQVGHMGRFEGPDMPVSTRSECTELEWCH
jgi:hypothetical protein